MCRSIAEAGDSTRRRCPVHRRDAVAVLRAVSQKTGFKKKDIEHMFTELRIAARGVAFEENDYREKYNDLIDQTKSNLEQSEDNAYLQILEERNTDTPPSHETLQALISLQDHAESRKAGLQRKFEELSGRYGVSVTEISRLYEQHRSEVDTSRNAINPEYNQQSVAVAWAKNLPSDASSIVALQRVQNELRQGREVTPEELGTQTIEKDGVQFSWNELGQLTVGIEGSVFRYRNIRPHTWAEVAESSNAVECWNSRVRGNPDYQYRSRNAADHETAAVQCPSCGQFMSQDGSHACPAREIIEFMQEGGLSFEEAAHAFAHETDEDDQETIGEVDNHLLAVGEEAVVSLEEAQEAMRVQCVQREGEVPHYTVEDNGILYPDPENESYSVGVREYREYIDASRVAVHSPNETSSTRYTLSEVSVWNSNNPDRALDLPENFKVVHTTESEIVGTYDPELVNAVRFNSTDHNNTGAPSYFRLGRRARPLHPSEDLSGLNPEPTSYDVEIDSEQSSENVEGVPMGVYVGSFKGPEVEVAREQILSGKTVKMKVSGEVTLPALVEGGRRIRSAHPYTITFDGAVTRDGDGIKATANHRELRCSCRVYAERYDCEHVYYARKHLNKMVSTYLNFSPRAAVVPSRFASAVAGSTMSQDGTRFSSISLNMDRSTDFGDRTNPRILGRLEGLSPADAYFFSNTDLDFGSYTPTPEALHELLDISDTVNFNMALQTRMDALPDDNSPRNIVYTTTHLSPVIERSEDGSLRLHPRTTARCSCGRFTSGTCSHVTTVYENFEALINRRELSSAPVVEQQPMGAHDYMIATLESHLRNVAERNGELIDEALLQSQVAAGIEAENALRAEAEERIEREREREYSYRRTAMNLARREMNYLWERDPDLRRDIEHYRTTLTERWNQESDMTGAEVFERLQRHQSGTTPIPFLESGATFGICDPSIPGSRRFGIEIEFDLEDYSYETLANIGDDLYEAGLTDDPSQQPYHSAAENGYESWSFEEDATVSGELVSPILDDSPESWDQVRQVCEILNRHGARATVNAGSHVHVSSLSYEASIAKPAELIRMVRHHEDTLFRASTNPTRRRHRGTSYCSPITNFTNAVVNDEDVERLPFSRMNASDHMTVVNLGGMSSDRGSNIEIRSWDGTLDPAVIQQQVAISVALVDRAEHNIEQEGFSANRSQTSEFSELTEDSLENSEHIAAFLNEIIPTEEGRERVLNLIARNPWQSTNR